MSVEKRAQKRKRESEPNIQDARRPVATITDLPLELVEKIAHHIDVKDVLKLMMVNKRLYSSYAMDRSIVFGKHVAWVSLREGLCFAAREGEVVIKKLVDSPPLPLNATLLPFAKRIDSCDKLEFSYTEGRTGRMFLGQLKSVNQLVFHARAKEDCQKFFTNFCRSVKDDAMLNMGFKNDQAMEEQLGKFNQLTNQLNRCENVTLGCNLKDWFHVYHELMMKTQTKMISVRNEPIQFDKIVEWIVNQGVPSKNSEAVIYISTYIWDSYNPADSEVGDLLSQAQGLQRVDNGESHSALVSRANELLNNKAFPLSAENSSCFRRRIDPTTSCIYVFEPEYLLFCAFLMPSQ